MLHHNFFWTGCLRVRITGDSCERFLNLCVNHEISFCRICRDQDGYTSIMMAGDFLKIKRLVKKSGVHIRIVQKSGMPFFLKQHRKRKLLLLGWIWCCFFLYLLSQHIWKIEIHGNQEITREQLMQYLNDSSIGYGSAKKNIDCKQTAADIRNAFPKVTWVAVRKQGTLLKIDLKENTDQSYSVLPEETSFDSSGSSLVAACDGTVTDMVIRSGVACVAIGQEVQKGDLLVSGIIPVTNDENEVVAQEYVNADADIVLEISDTYTSIISREQMQILFSEEVKHRYYLKFFQQFFSTLTDLPDTTQHEIVTEEHQLTLFSDFYLPVIWGKIRIRTFAQYPVLLSDRKLKELSIQRLDKFIAEKKEKGVQILKKNVRIETGMTFCKCVCTYQAYTSDTRRIPSMQTEVMEDNEEGTFS